MARVIVILTLMVAITATMFAITRKPAIAPGVAANGPTATVKLTDLPRALPAAVEAMDKEEASLTSAAPRAVTNVIDPEAPKSAQDVTNGPVAGAAPTIGTAGIDQGGRASFTGTASPGDQVALVWDSKPMGTATVDRAGNWEIAFKARAVKGEHEVYVSAEGKDGNTVIGPQRAFIRPPVTEGGLPRIALKSVDVTDKTVQEGTVAATELRTGLVVEKVVGAEPGLTMLVGKADPGATVKVLINGKVAGETRVAKDGAWTIAASNPTTKAAKRLRLELHDAKGNKLDQAELPYEVPAASARVAAVSTIVKLDSPSARKARTKAKPAGDDLAALFKVDAKSAERPKDKIIRVRRGDSLWRIAKRHLGKGRKWAAFYKANKAKIDNPNLIFPGQTLIIPG